MKKNYTVEGMSCEGCVSTVKKTLLDLSGITEAEVHLQPPTAVLTMNKLMDVRELQAQLSKAGHYTIKEIVYI